MGFRRLGSVRFWRLWSVRFWLLVTIQLWLLVTIQLWLLVTHGIVLEFASLGVGLSLPTIGFDAFTSPSLKSGPLSRLDATLGRWISWRIGAI